MNKIPETTEQNIPETTIETLARSFFKEAVSYGFKRVDYLRFVNTLLDITMRKKEKGEGREGVETENTINESIYSERINLPLAGKRVRIRAFDAPEERPIFERWLADEYGRLFLLSRMTAKTLHIDELIQNNSNVIGMITLLDETPIGSVAYLNYDQIQHKAELRKLIGEPQMRGKGLAKEATKLWIQYGMTALGLKKIYLNTLNTNIRNIKLNEELGFKVEGILRNEVFFDGKYHDVLRMGLWRE